MLPVHRYTIQAGEVIHWICRVIQAKLLPFISRLQVAAGVVTSVMLILTDLAELNSCT